MLVVFAFSACTPNKRNANENKPSEGDVTSKEDNTESETSQTGGTTSAVAIIDGMSIRKEPTKAGKWLTNISLGETVEFTGNRHIDSADKNREYLEVVLLDGTQGWCMSWGLIVDGQIAAILSDASIYKRPSELTKTDKAFKTMDMVVISNSKEDWLEVVGKRKTLKGWIMKRHISLEPNDVTFAILVGKALGKSKGKERLDKITAFLLDMDDNGSVLLGALIEEQDELESQFSSTNTEESADTLGSL